jgi:rhodanese-related sulfurtransferase
MALEDLVSLRIGTIVDVRSGEEYQLAHCSASVSIPFNEFALRIRELCSLPEPLILCCASGNRSGLAERQLKSLGISCINAGSWLDIQFILLRGVM